MENEGICTRSEQPSINYLYLTLPSLFISICDYEYNYLFYSIGYLDMKQMKDKQVEDLTKQNEGKLM